VLGTTRHDEKLRWPERNVAFAHLDFQLAVQDQEELVGVRVLVPGELTLNLHDRDVVVVIWAIFFGDQCSVKRASQHYPDIHRVHVHMTCDRARRLSTIGRVSCCSQQVRFTSLILSAASACPVPYRPGGGPLPAGYPGGCAWIWWRLRRPSFSLDDVHRLRSGR